MKVFVTGHRGYIGVHLVELLKEAGHQVTGCDLGLFDGCNWEPFAPADRELVKDTRAITPRDLDGHDCVMQLAAMSNDPMGALDASITYEVNRDASIRLAQLAKRAGVARYLFAGSCSIYGAGKALDLDESAAFNPLTAYAHSKIESEKTIAELADASFSPVFLRNATAYGHSPMLRIDLVVNNLLGSALAYGQIRIQSDGTPWRPLIHCRDIARAFVALAEAPREVVHNRAINIGANAENYQVKDVGDQVKRLIPSAEVVYTGEVGADPRNYRVNFDLLYRLLPDFRLAYDLPRGMEELHRKMLEHGFSRRDFEGDQFVRLRILKKRYELLRQGAEAIRL
jgi:nucleoside-diphosphate-sugar epimerase